MVRLLIGRVSAKRSRNMRAIRSKNTSAEKQLAKLLDLLGIKYKMHGSDLPGNPDFVIKSKRMLIFCDGDFWHGRYWQSERKKLKVRRQFWINKIEKNISRDKKINSQLKKLGWKVIRIWGSDISKRQVYVLNRLKKILLKR